MSSRKAVAYCATRNLYGALSTAIFSLLYNNPQITDVYVYAEDPELPYPTDTRVRVRDISTMPNYLNTDTEAYKQQQFTYMCLVRLELPKFHPDLDRILYLDVDTIVDRNISELWYMDLSGADLAAVRERKELHMSQTESYFNAGVLMMNLEHMRKTHTDDRVLSLINDPGFSSKWPDQDAINQTCSIKAIPSDYNAAFCTEYSFNPAIIHYAGYKHWWEMRWQIARYEYWAKYSDLQSMELWKRWSPDKAVTRAQT